MNLKRATRGIVIAALASVFVYVATALFTDGPKMAAALRSFPLTVLVLMLVLGAVSFVIRGLRWGRSCGSPAAPHRRQTPSTCSCPDRACP